MCKYLHICFCGGSYMYYQGSQDVSQIGGEGGGGGGGA